MSTYLSAALSGKADPFWPHFVLLLVSIVAAFTVGAGIIFESNKYSAAVHRVATWLVLVGIAVESSCTVLLFVFDEGLSSAQQSQILVATDRATDAGFEAAIANNSAAEANERAAELKKENLLLESQIAPRRLSSDDIIALKDAMATFENRQISIWSYGVDVESRMLATQIKSALVAAHVPVIDRIGEMLGSTNPRVGVIITGPDDQLVSALLGTLMALSPAKAPYHEGFTMDGVGPVVAAPPAEIFVGIKPIIP